MPGSGIQLVSDQVYHPIYHGPPARSAARLSHATVIGDFSKALCLSGVRLGWIIDHDARRRERYRNARHYFTITGNVFGEHLAVLALKHSDSIYGRACRVARENPALLDQLLAQHGNSLRWVRPRGGMTAFPWLADGTDAKRVLPRACQSRRADCAWGLFRQPAHFRVGFAASGERFPLALERFAEFLQ